MSRRVAKVIQCSHIPPLSSSNVSIFCNHGIFIKTKKLALVQNYELNSSPFSTVVFILFQDSSQDTLPHLVFMSPEDPPICAHFPGFYDLDPLMSIGQAFRRTSLNLNLPNVFSWIDWPREFLWKLSQKCPSQCIILGPTLSTLFITNNINLDNLVKVVSVRLLHCKEFSFAYPIC